MKKLTILLAVILSTFLLYSCRGNVSSVSIDYGDSQIYTKQDMDDAISLIKAEFKEFDGCVLHSLKFAGDTKCKNNIEYCNSLDKDANFSECMIFTSSFQTPKNGDGAWSGDTEYDWEWYLARNTNGKWELLTYGY